MRKADLIPNQHYMTQLYKNLSSFAADLKVFESNNKRYEQNSLLDPEKYETDEEEILARFNQISDQPDSDDKILNLLESLKKDSLI